MGTAPALSEPRPIWHVRGTWNPRDDRRAFAVWLGVLWIGMIVGFSADFPRYLRENPAAPRVTYFHGAVFAGWLLIVTVQVLLVLKDRVAWHRKLGWFGLGWACLMAVMAPWAALASDAVNLHLPSGDEAFLSVQIVDLGGFLLLLAWGILLRTNPAAHKRIMILATVSLADPGFARFTQWLWPTGPNGVLPWFLWIFYGNVLLFTLMIAWDWSRGRLMPQMVSATAGLLGAEYLASLLHSWGPWKALTLRWVQAWARSNW